MGDFYDLQVYQLAHSLAMDIFEVTKLFPKEERYSLTDQIRRSSRSVCANFGKAYRRRNYPAHFLGKLSDCDAENTETEIWVQFCFDCKYIDEEKRNNLLVKCRQVGKLLGFMIKNPDKFK
jgi:four helix bundle protein